MHLNREMRTGLLDQLSIGHIPVKHFDNGKNLLEAIALTSCSSCGIKLREGAKFCHSCGNKTIRQSKVESKRTCPNCGSEIRPETVFCHKCGARSGKPAEIKATPKKTPVKIDVSKKEKACKNCGTVLRPNVNFCVRCGTDNSPSVTEKPVKPVIAIDNAKKIPVESTPVVKAEKAEEKIVEVPTSASKEVEEAMAGLKGLKYYTKSLEIDDRNKTAVTSLFSGPIADIKWKFEENSIVLITECQTNFPRDLNLEIKMKESIPYKFTDPYAGLTINSQDDQAISKLQRESRIAEKIKKITPPVELKVGIASKIANIEIITSITKNNVKMLFNLTKDLGYFLNITLR